MTDQMKIRFRSMRTWSGRLVAVAQVKDYSYCEYTGARSPIAHWRDARPDEMAAVFSSIPEATDDA